MSFIASTIHPPPNRRRTMVLGIAEQRLGRREWAVGGYSIADIHLFRLFWRYFNSLRPTPADFPGLSAHYDRMMARPAVQRELEIESAVGYHLPQWQKCAPHEVA
jgi:glutathione S-transferase